MAYPPRPFRLTSYRQAENAGQDISTSNLDGEFNELVEIVDQIVTRLQAISTASGLLQQSAAMTTLGLAGQQRFVATAAQTTFISTIVFELGTVAIVTANGVVLDPNLVVISNNAGFVQVVIPAQTAGTVVVLDAFQPGAGIVSRLADTASPTNGASMIGINDALALYAATTVEGALAEVRTALNTLATSLGVVANLWTRAGTGVGGGAATAPFQLGGFRITGLGDGTAGTDAVTLNQLNAALSSLGFLATLFIRADGTVPFTGDQPMGGHKITGLGAPTGANDAATKTYVDTQEALDLRLDGTRPMTAALNMGTHLINNVVNPVAAQDAATKAYVDALLPSAGVGGGGIDGALSNASVLATDGLYDFTAGSITAPKTFPAFAIVRINGNAAISAAITVSTVVTAVRAADDHGGTGGAGSGVLISQASGGGGAVGAGGAGGAAGGAGGAGVPWNTLKAVWAELPPSVRAILGGTSGALVGGAGALPGVAGGGCLVLLVDGNLDLTGGTITADGAPGTAAVGAGFAGVGGGGGGTVIIVCTGTITGGTINARGGAGGTSTFASGGGGGGGLVLLVAPSFSGARTAVVTGGTSPATANTGVAGSGGANAELTYTAAQIRGMLSR